jgi:hypothetical protein
VLERSRLASLSLALARLAASRGLSGGAAGWDGVVLERSRLASRSSRKKFFDFLHQTFSEHRGVAQSVGIVAPHGKDTHRIFVP